MNATSEGEQADNGSPTAIAEAIARTRALVNQVDQCARRHGAGAKAIAALMHGGTALTVGQNGAVLIDEYPAQYPGLSIFWQRGAQAGKSETWIRNEDGVNARRGQTGTRDGAWLNMHFEAIARDRGWRDANPDYLGRSGLEATFNRMNELRKAVTRATAKRGASTRILRQTLDQFEKHGFDITVSMSETTREATQIKLTARTPVGAVGLRSLTGIKANNKSTTWKRKREEPAIDIEVRTGSDDGETLRLNSNATLGMEQLQARGLTKNERWTASRWQSQLTRLLNQNEVWRLLPSLSTNARDSFANQGREKVETTTGPR